MGSWPYLLTKCFWWRLRLSSFRRRSVVAAHGAIVGTGIALVGIVPAPDRRFCLSIQPGTLKTGRTSQLGGQKRAWRTTNHSSGWRTAQRSRRLQDQRCASKPLWVQRLRGPTDRFGWLGEAPLRSTAQTLRSVNRRPKQPRSRLLPGPEATPTDW